jgi:tripartite-type tricarboxylate transporter receptor subunit TctC
MTNLKLPRRQFLRLAAGAAALPVLSRIARAQAYPTRPVRLIAGFPAGSITDVMARFAAQCSRSALASHTLSKTVRVLQAIWLPKQSFVHPLTAIHCL